MKARKKTLMSASAFTGAATVAGRRVGSLLRNAKTLLVAGLVVVVAVGVGVAVAAAKTNSYTVTKLVSDVPGFAANLDPALGNPWGLAAQASSPWWVADNQTGLATLYQPDGGSVPLTVQLTSSFLQAQPTGIVANPDPTFMVSDGVNTGPAAFLFATLGGDILGWSQRVAPTRTVVAASTPGTVYTGLAIGSISGSATRACRAVLFRSGSRTSTVRSWSRSRRGARAADRGSA
jgi:hypothetical protein